MEVTTEEQQPQVQTMKSLIPLPSPYVACATCMTLNSILGPSRSSFDGWTTSGSGLQSRLLRCRRFAFILFSIHTKGKIDLLCYFYHFLSHIFPASIQSKLRATEAKSRAVLRIRRSSCGTCNGI